MDQIKINQARWSEDEKYVNGIYPAFKMEFDDGYCEYAAQVAEDRLVYATQGACELIEEGIPALKVKVLSAKNEAEKKYVGNIYEAFRMVYPDGTDYAVRVDKESIYGFAPYQVEIVTDEVVAVEEQITKSTRKILLVEDGSVDSDALEEWCADNGIKLVVYRQGAAKPEFLDY